MADPALHHLESKLWVSLPGQRSVSQHQRQPGRGVEGHSARLRGAQPAACGQLHLSRPHEGAARSLHVGHPRFPCPHWHAHHRPSGSPARLQRHGCADPQRLAELLQDTHPDRGGQIRAQRHSLPLSGQLDQAGAVSPARAECLQLVPAGLHRARPHGGGRHLRPGDAGGVGNQSGEPRQLPLGIYLDESRRNEHPARAGFGRGRCHPGGRQCRRAGQGGPDQHQQQQLHQQPYPDL